MVNVKKGVMVEVNWDVGDSKFLVKIIVLVGKWCFLIVLLMDLG